METKIDIKQTVKIMIFAFVTLIAIYIPLFLFYALCEIEAFSFLNDNIVMQEMIAFSLSIAGYIVFLILYRMNTLPFKYIPVSMHKINFIDIIIVTILFFSYFIVELVYLPPSGIKIQRTEIELLTAWISILIIAPVVEEIIFRGIIFELMLKINDKITSTVLTSIVFALFHFKPKKIIVAFVFSLFICWVYYLTKNIILCMLGHFVFNGSIWVFVLLEKFNLCSVKFSATTGLLVIPLHITILAHIFLAISCAFMFIRRRYGYKDSILKSQIE